MTERASLRFKTELIDRYWASTVFCSRNPE